MSEIFFTNSDQIPLPPNEVRVRNLSATPRRDGQRIDVKMALTPFQKRPNVELRILNALGEEVAALSVVEAIDAEMDFTMHLRNRETAGHYSLEMRVFYADIESHEPALGAQTSSGEILNKAKQIVDQRKIEFEIPETA
jgi:hypothetical protein